jgi:hypothetical protein
VARVTEPPQPPAPMDEAAYEALARAEMTAWTQRMGKTSSVLGGAARGLQGRINRMIPERVHTVVTAAIEGTARAILTGSHLTTARPLKDAPLSLREAEVRRRIAAYRATAAAEGGVAGAGGFALALAEFPTLLATKIKLLFDIAALYGHDVKALPERLYILKIFEAAFSGPERRHDILADMAEWDARAAAHPQSMDAVDWRRFQQEYRDYIDLAKMAQLIPVIGAPVGVVVNYRLVNRLGEAAINAYRMRWFAGP